MSLIPRHSPLHTAGTDTADHELQTDIMRFLAILALCLMAVFALVQGLPRTPAADLPDTRPALLAEVRSLQARNDRLRAEQQALEAELQRLHRERAQMLTTLERSRREAGTSGYRLRRSAARLRRLEQALQERNRGLEQVTLRKETERRELADVERRLKSVRRDLPTAPPAQEPAEANTPADPPPPEGFTLRFASEQALRALVAAGRVALYARSGNAFWRLRTGDDRDRFEAASAPDAYYEMTPQTVPAGFVAALGRRTGSALAPGATWGVTLPAPTAGRVRALMSSHHGGTLVIGADGEVRLEPETRS